jgi:hypothetical protein
MKKGIISLACVAFFALSEVSAATVLDFENLWQGFEETSQISSPYEGFNFNSNAYYITKHLQPGSGYDYGTTGHVSMFTGGGYPISMTSNTPFNLVSADITSAWDANEAFTVEGWRGGTLVAFFNGTTHNDAQYHFTFNNLNNIDTVWFYHGPGGQLDIDNIEYTAVPLPHTLVLLGSGLLGLAAVRRSRK